MRCLDTNDVEVRGESFIADSYSALKISFIPCMYDPTVTVKTTCAPSTEMQSFISNHDFRLWTTRNFLSDENS